MSQRILFVMHMPPPVHGAAMVGQYIHDSSLVNSKYDAEYINIATAKSLNDIGSLSLRKVIDFVKIYHKVRSSVKRHRPDLVYITPNAKGISFFKEYLVVQLIKKRGIKIIAQYHNKGVSKKQDIWYYNMLYKRFFKGIKVILLSKRLYPDIEKYVDIRNVLICPNTIPMIPFDNEYKALDSSSVRFLFLSNMIKSKGVLDILDACKILRESGSKFICDFVGAPTSEISKADFDTAVIKNDISNCVNYYGPQYGDDKEKFWSMADIFVFPTLDDAFPLVLLEAMQHSVPIVSTEEGGIPDMVQDGINGLICKKNDPKDLAAKLSTLLSDKHLRQTMGMKGYEIYKERYTVEQWEHNLIECLDSALSS